MLDTLDPIFRKVADKEVNLVNSSVTKSLQQGLHKVGPKKECDQIIKDNIKDYRGIIKAAGFGSPNKKYKEILGAAGLKDRVMGNSALPPGLASVLGSQQNLSLKQLQQKENKSIYAIQS